MKVIRKTDSDSAVELVDVAEPSGAARVLAAGVNPVDLAIASGRLPFRKADTTTTLGFEGVARTASDEVVYFSAPTPPSGSFGEYVELEGAELATVPQGLDPVLAAAIGVPGIAAWSSLFDGAHFTTGDRVLVLGATGTVGRIAAQVALAEGAAVVAGTARNDQGLSDLSSLGITPVDISSSADISTHLGEASADGFDVVIDTLWGEPLVAAIDHLRTGARIAQVGNSAGADAHINGPAFRNRGVTLSGHSNFLRSATQRRHAYENVAKYAAQGTIDLPLTTVTLPDFPDFWQRMANGDAKGKTVLVP